jgi:N-succinyldiaminopimelate aminotransferase
MSCDRLVLNSPHNPTGHVATPAELQLVAEVCKAHDLLAVSDEVYEHCVFPSALSAPPRHLQLAAEPGMRERTITIGSGGKLFALTGWRVAWAYGPAALIQPLSRSHTHLTFSAPTPLQAGIAAALDVEDGLDEVPVLFGGNWQLLADALREGTSIGSICEAQGGYFLVAETDGSSDVDFCRRLAEGKGVVCTPMSVFYSGEPPAEPCRLVRFTVCKSRDYIQRACAALRS